MRDASGMQRKSMSTACSIDRALIHRKVAGILADVARLRALLANYSYEALLADEARATEAERRFERIVHRAIDINFHLIRAAGTPPPSDYTDSFRQLATITVLDPTLAQTLAPIAGARNVLIHEYDDLDAQRFYAALERAVAYMPAYLAAVDRYIEAHGEAANSTDSAA